MAPKNWIIRTIDSTKVGADDLTNFVFPLYFAPNAVAALKSTSNGGLVYSGLDIRPYDSLITTEWKYYLRKYDPTTGELLIWVQYPGTLSHSSSSPFALTFGDRATYLANGSSTACFDSTFNGFYEFQNASGVLTAVDLTGIGSMTLHSTPTGVAGPLSWMDAMHCAAASSQYVDGGAGSAPNYDLSSWAFWVKLDSLPSAGGYMALLSAVDSGPRFMQTFVKDTGKLAGYFGNSPLSEIAFADGLGTNTLSTGTWYHIGMRRSPISEGGIHCRVYVNGAADNTTDNGGDNLFELNCTDPIYFGQDVGTSGRLLDGAIAGAMSWNDGIGGSTLRPNGWFTALYNSQNDPSTFSTGTTVTSLANTGRFARRTAAFGLLGVM